MLQGLEWSPIPWQADPPLLGGGLVHVRDRDCFPPPQVLLQLLHLPHSDQLKKGGKRGLLNSSNRINGLLMDLPLPPLNQH